MEGRYLQRTIEPVLWRAARRWPLVLLTGPFESGKTTVARRVFGRTHSYVSLGRPDARAWAQAAPQSFLNAYPSPAILDGIHYAPDLFSHLRERVEGQRGRPGQYLLIGAEDPALVVRVREVFGGRVTHLRLLPLSQLEAAGDPQGRLPWEGPAAPRRPQLSGRELWERLWQGWYPEVAAGRAGEVTLWQARYGQTYLEREVLSHRRIGEEVRFQQLLRLLATRSGQPLNLSALARPLGVAVNTVKAWVSVLEATGQVILLQSYPAPSYRRMAKTPKVYLSDTGALCYLAGLPTPEEAASSPLSRPIFETAVLGELMKVFTHRGEEPRVFFWRTALGDGVDFVVQAGGRLLPLEARLTLGPSPELTEGIQAFQRHFGERAGTGYVIHAGVRRVPLAPRGVAAPFSGI